MGNPLVQSPVADLMSQLMRHQAQGNVVEAVTFSKSGDADKDFGRIGTVEPITKLIEPEPFVNAVNVVMVQKSNGAYEFSDLKMTMARESLSFEAASDPHTEFNVNGVRYQVKAYTPGPSAWEFVIRRKAESATP